MEPRKLDRLIAEKVMGWKREGANYHTKPKHLPSQDFPGEIIDNWDSKGPHDFLISPESNKLYVGSCGCESTADLPDYSTSISDAWLVVERMREQKCYVGFECSDRETEHLCPEEMAKWYAGFCLGRGSYNEVGADTLPFAICLAALKALGVELPNA